MTVNFDETLINIGGGDVCNEAKGDIEVQPLTNGYTAS
jgi:hypothetical protein